MLPVVYLPQAEKYFKKLKDKQLKSKFKSAILKIREKPSIGQEKSGDLRGIFALDVYHAGQNYELAYRVSQLDDGEIVVIILAGTRQNFYKELKRYLT
ncbi:MAG: type II toxin-antitoxin system RelE/ParE family toxin [Firmicutes bacterium]|nr:type II toxin-antitoxin system RelE/ParE family toxin [Bacillota bacterium]